jgi:NUMOD3 motif
MGRPLGFKLSDDTKRKIGLGNKGKCLGRKLTEKQRRAFTMKGKHHSEETKRKIRESNLKVMHWNYLTDKLPSITALHRYVKRHNPIPKNCSNCGKEKKLQLANINGIYDRNMKNYKYLCGSCHAVLDKKIFNIKHMRVLPKW